MSYPAAGREIANDLYDNFSKLLFPNVLIWGLVSELPGFPHKVCGNDGLRMAI